MHTVDNYALASSSEYPHTIAVPCTKGECALTVFPGCVSKPSSFKLTCLLAIVLLLTVCPQPMASERIKLQHQKTYGTTYAKIPTQLTSVEFAHVLTSFVKTPCLTV